MGYAYTDVTVEAAVVVEILPHWYSTAGSTARHTLADNPRVISEGRPGGFVSWDMPRESLKRPTQVTILVELSILTMDALMAIRELEP